jgi:hypothetical protein
MTASTTGARTTAKQVAKALGGIGYDAKVVYQDLAVKVTDADGNEISTVWMPIWEATPTGLGGLFLWGRTGDENQAPAHTGLPELLQLIARTLQ